MVTLNHDEVMVTSVASHGNQNQEKSIDKFNEMGRRDHRSSGGSPSGQSPPMPSSPLAAMGSSSSSRYKTELCRPFEEFGLCKYSDKCQFAHGVGELRRLVRHPKYKTELCRTFHTMGLCPYGHRCHFIHNEMIYINNLISSNNPLLSAIGGTGPGAARPAATTASPGISSLSTSPGMNPLLFQQYSNNLTNSNQAQATANQALNLFDMAAAASSGLSLSTPVVPPGLGPLPAQQAFLLSLEDEIMAAAAAAAAAATSQAQPSNMWNYWNNVTGLNKNQLPTSTDASLYFNQMLFPPVNPLEGNPLHLRQQDDASLGHNDIPMMIPPVATTLLPCHSPTGSSSSDTDSNNLSDSNSSHVSSSSGVSSLVGSNFGSV